MFNKKIKKRITNLEIGFSTAELSRLFLANRIDRLEKENKELKEQLLQEHRHLKAVVKYLDLRFEREMIDDPSYCPIPTPKVEVLKAYKNKKK